MRKLVSLLLIFTMLLALTACGTGPKAPETTAPAETETAAAAETLPAEPETEPVEETEPAAEEGTSTPYSDILNAYYNALAEGWSIEKYMEAGMNYLPGLINDMDQVGYYLDDLDGDQTPELLIGAVGDTYIYAMYTLVDGNPITVIHGSERNTYQMLADGSVYNRGSNGAASTGHLFYAFADKTLVFQDALMFDANADAENPWFYAEDEDWDVSNDLSYGTGDAEAHIQMVEDSIQPIAYMPFSSYHS